MTFLEQITLLDHFRFECNFPRPVNSVNLMRNIGDVWYCSCVLISLVLLFSPLAWTRKDMHRHFSLTLSHVFLAGLSYFTLSSLAKKVQPLLGNAVSPIKLHSVSQMWSNPRPQVIDIKVIVPKFINGETCVSWRPFPLPSF